MYYPLSVLSVICKILSVMLPFISATYRIISFCFSSSCFCRMSTFSICMRSCGVRCDKSGISSMAFCWNWFLNWFCVYYALVSLALHIKLNVSCTNLVSKSLLCIRCYNKLITFRLCRISCWFWFCLGNF